jgi:Tol biopolymer transport system component/tRNA A-37 threonylcarbamoyl transferase component Bud32
MGEVYRAKDPRLNRDVAIKVLAQHLTTDQSALLRFEREAQALAALSHPGIVGVYDVGRYAGSSFVVMEFLEGETLRARLANGTPGIRKSLEYGVQIAHALAAAHERGIVHRDLKPENVFVCPDGRIKLLDFGIVQLASASVAASAETMAVSATPRATAPNTMIGTVGYMAPEQARGQLVDARADIFSLGAVLYELVTGKRAFDGDTAVDVLAAVLHTEPPEIHQDSRVPPALDRIIRRCLEKRPEERFQSARDLAFALEGVASGSGTQNIPAAAGQPPLVPWWTVVLAGLLALGLGVLAGGMMSPAAEEALSPGAVRFTFDANRGQVPEISVSPDGRYLAWTEITSGGRLGGLWVRRLDGAQPSLLQDTPSSGPTFWSPDGREVVVLNGNRLIAIDVERGGRRVLIELDPGALPLRGGDWLGQTLLLGTGNAIWVHDLTGRTARRAATTVQTPREVWHGWPTWLPGNRRFFYTVGLANGETETRIGSLDDDSPIRIALPGTTSRVKLDSRGYLVFAQNRVLIAQRIDLESGALQGPTIRLAGEVFQNAPNGWAAVDASRNGVVAWRAPGIDDAQFEWVDREGRTAGIISQPDAYTNFDLSPDGTRIVATRRRGESGGTLFLIDPARSLTTPISDQNPGASISDPTWSPDGQTIAYRRSGALVTRNVFGGEERVIKDWPGYPDSWSRDGKFLIVGRPMGPDYQLWAVAMDGSGAELPLVQGVSLADEARFSPDGKWVVFHAAIAGAPEVFAIRFPPTGERWQLSTGGGVQPRWRNDGRELYYLAPTGQVMVVATPDRDPTQARTPEPLFGLRLDPSPAFDQYTPLPDGQRFVVRRQLRPGGADTAPVHVIVDWPETLPQATGGM